MRKRLDDMPPPPRQEEAAAAKAKANDFELFTYGELIKATLDAIKAGEQDREMVCRAELKHRFRVSDEQISTALFKRHSAEQVQHQTAVHDSVSMADVAQLEYLLDGWAPRGDLALTYGAFGTGKTTLALAKLYAHVNGRNLLDRDTPCPPGRGLFIATDSGAGPLKKAMHDLGIDADNDPLLRPGHPDQRVWVWAHEPSQGHSAWVCDIHGVIRLEQFIRAKGITYVVIDSAKAVSSAAGWSYTSNESVKALLQYLREGVAMPTGCCLEFLSHDGTAAGSHSGAKAWAEDPSMVCQLTAALDPDGHRIGVTAQFKKDRAAHVDAHRTVTFSFIEGELSLQPGAEVVGSCADALLTILWEAYQRGVESVSGKELAQEAYERFRRSTKTVQNTLGKLAGTGKGPNPTPVLKLKRSRYALAPAEIQRRSVASSNRGVCGMGGSLIKPTALQEVCLTPSPTPTLPVGSNATPEGVSEGVAQTPVVTLDLGQLPPGRDRAPLQVGHDDDPHWPPRPVAAA